MTRTEGFPGMVPAFVFMIGLIGLLPVAHAADEIPPPEELPWALRDHYTFTFDDATFIYAVDNAEWELTINGLGLLLEDVGSTITLADGTVHDISDFGHGDSDRSKVDTPLGEATEYRTSFAEKDGIAPSHIVMNHRSKPYFTMGVEVTNKGEAPIEVAKITPLVIGPGNLSALGPDTEVRMRRLRMHGPCPMIDKSAGSLVAMFNDEPNDLTLLFAVIPGEKAVTSVRLQGHGGGWQGVAQCVFDPPVKVAPGETLRSDPIWVSFSIPEPAEVDAVYAWAHSAQPELNSAATEAPGCWVTVDEGAPAGHLMEAAKTWSAAGVRHALVPGSWEAKPGSWQGAAPRYPKDMAKLAKLLHSSGIKPGLTVDPLGAQDPNSQWTVRSPDGFRWLNPAVPAARSYAVKQMQQAMEWGFDFFAVKPSAIPDAVLKHFNITRAQADYWAMHIARTAAKDKPVFPSSASTIGANLDDWLEAAGATSRLKQYQVVTGPVRFDATKSGALSGDVATAMSFCGAPVEFFVGKNTKPPKAVSRAVARPAFAAHPFDAENARPRLWHLKSYGNDEADPTSAIVAFPGAEAWDAEELCEGKQVTIWRGNGKSFERLPAGPVPVSSALTIYNVVPSSRQPVVMAASCGPQLCIYDVSDTRWDTAKLTFTGSLSATMSTGGTAFVYAPAGLKLRSATAGKDTVRKPDVNGLVPIQTDGGGRTNITVVYKR